MGMTDILQFALERGIIDSVAIRSIRERVDMERRKDFLCKHGHKIWQDKQGYFLTYLPDSTGKRKLLKKRTREELENCIIAYYENEECAPYLTKVFDDWTNEKLRYKEISRGTYDKYCNEYKRHIRGQPIERKRITEITEKELEDFIRRTIADKQLTVKAYGNLRIIIMGMWKYAKRNRWTDLSISTFFKDIDLSRRVFARSQSRDRPQVFLQAEINLLFAYFRDNPSVEHYGIMLVFQTGMREGELSGLKFSDIAQHSIHICRQEIKYKDEITGKNTHKIVEYTKTDAGNRTIFIPPKAQETIKMIRLLNPTGEYLMQKGDRHFWTNTFNDRLYKACDAVGIERRSMHKIRKTYGTMLIDGGAEDSLIMKQMGHANIETTRKYYYYSNRQDEQNLETITKIVSL